MAAQGLGYYVWISARGEMQGHVSVVRFERNAYVPRFVESFNVCPGTVYSIAHIPAMNSRSDQSADRYHTKYGFPFPTVWLGSHSSKYEIYSVYACDFFWNMSVFLNRKLRYVKVLVHESQLKVIELFIECSRSRWK